MSLKILIDVDTGVDDAWALALLLNSDQATILGITCVAGNTSLKQVSNNTAYLLATLDKTHVPIYEGAECPLIGEVRSVSNPDLKHFFGANGFGDVALPPLDNLPAIQPDNAIAAMNRIVSQNKGEVSLVCCGPLTNVALAARTYPNFIDDLKEIFVMGGNYTAMGNTTMCAEFNFHMDPEAASIVLSSSQGKLTLLPWETCLSLQIPYKWRLDLSSELIEGCGRGLRLLDKVESSVLTRGQRLGLASWINCDQLLASIVLDRSVATSSFRTHATVELAGTHTRGQLVMDHLNTRQPNLTIIKAVDQHSHLERLLQLKQL